jgi:DnaJ family protein A protein 5
MYGTHQSLSDPQERKWYDDHRDAILAGWSASDAANSDTADIMLFSVAPYMHPGCYSSYHDEKGGFFQVYQGVFEHIISCECKQSETVIELPTNFGTSETSWSIASVFYKSWECFSSALNFAWEDTYNAREDAPSRRVRRLMEEENNKARRSAKKEYKNDILQLVAFVKKRDPRMKAHIEEQERLKKEREENQKQDKIQRKKEKQKAKEAWREASLLEMEKAEEEDRLKGRIRLADLEDDYDYGGGKKKKRGKKKNKKRAIEEEEETEGEPDTTETNQKTVEDTAESAPTDSPSASDDGETNEIPTLDSVSPIIDTNTVDQNFEQHDDDEQCIPVSLSSEDIDVVQDDDDESFSESESESEDEPEIWRCDCCRKDFKSEGQMQNHMKSKKHKEAFKKYQAKLKKKEQKIMAEMMEEMTLDNQ